MSSVFPTSDYHHACVKSEGCRVDPGLTLRDYFAAQILNGLLERALDSSYVNANVKDACRLAYSVADSMMEARKK